MSTKPTFDVRNLQSQHTGTKTAPITVSKEEPTVTPAASEELPPIPNQATTVSDIIQEYLKYLEENDIQKEDIFIVLDTIIQDGSIDWTFQLFDKIPVVLRMRPHWVNEHIYSILEKEQPALMTRATTMISTLNLAGSLASYNGRSFFLEYGKPETFNATLDFVRGLPFPIVDALTRKLAIFDRVLAVATSDWAIENFQTPQSVG